MERSQNTGVKWSQEDGGEHPTRNLDRGTLTMPSLLHGRDALISDTATWLDAVLQGSTALSSAGDAAVALLTTSTHTQLKGTLTSLHLGK